MHIMWIDRTALSLTIKSKVENKKTILFCYFVNIMLELSLLPVSCKIYTFVTGLNINTRFIKRIQNLKKSPFI